MYNTKYIYNISFYYLFIFIYLTNIIASLVSAAFPSITAQKDYIVIYVELILEYN